MIEEKSHVGMEHQRCLVCDCDFETGAILLDRRLRKSLPRVAITGFGLCPEHKRDGFVTLIGCRNSPAGDRMQPEEADRSGRTAMVKLEAWDRIFDVPAPEGGIAYVEDSVLDHLERLQAQAESSE